MHSDRRDERKSLAYRGWIYVPDWPLLPCTIEDASEGGVRLVTDDAIVVPDHFKLVFSPTSKSYRECVVRWRRTDSLGVQFVNRHMAPSRPAEERAPATVW